MHAHSIDLDLLNTGHGLQQRKMQGDLRREVLAVLERVGTEKGVRYTEVAKALNEQSSIPIEAAELTSVIKVGQASVVLGILGLQAEMWTPLLFCRHSSKRVRLLSEEHTTSGPSASSSAERRTHGDSLHPRQPPSPYVSPFFLFARSVSSGCTRFTEAALGSMYRVIFSLADTGRLAARLLAFSSTCPLRPA